MILGALINSRKIVGFGLLIYFGLGSFFALVSCAQG